MRYRETITLKDGRTCLLRNGTEQDGASVRELFACSQEQTDNLRTYPDEVGMDDAQEGRYLQEKAESSDEIEIVAEIDGVVVGSGGIERVGSFEKVRHRAEFGVSVLKEYWGLGIGRAMTQACITCARKAGYAQLELDVVADNERAIALYRDLGFVEYGRNPYGFRSRMSGWQELVLMRLELDVS
ncbi:MAG: GNAT family N-acetyltransferase [Coriobacteriales bacterium]|nr:GNAT family N-acetyltransferase [Coriobacteriales bacterium]